MKDLKQKIKDRVVVDQNGCWIWQGKISSSGYGIFTFGTAKNAHRASYIAFKGPINNRLHVCHSCDVPACVNPDHLWLGTASDNRRDCVAKGRHKLKIGKPPSDEYANSDFNKKELMEIREYYKHHTTNIAEYFAQSNHVELGNTYRIVNISDSDGTTIE